MKYALLVLKLGVLQWATFYMCVAHGFLTDLINGTSSTWNG